MTAETDPQSPSQPTTPAVAEESDGRAELTRITLRFVALILLIVAANAWLILQFGLNVTKLVVVELAIALAAGLRKKLHKADDQAIDRFLRRSLYALLGVPFLATAWAGFLLLTSLVSVATIRGPQTSAACIAGDAETCRQPLLAGADASTFLLWTSPAGRDYEARLGSRRPASFSHVPWRATRLTDADFRAFPSVILRVEFPHRDIEGGRIEIRDAVSKEVLAAGNTTSDAASLLLGPEPAVTAELLNKWDRELTAAGVTSAPAKAARIEAWMKFIRARTNETLAANRQLEAVFRNDGQLAGGEVVAARSSTFRLGDAGVQDLVIERIVQ